MLFVCDLRGGQGPQGLDVVDCLAVQNDRKSHKVGIFAQYLPASDIVTGSHADTREHEHSTRLSLRTSVLDATRVGKLDGIVAQLDGDACATTDVGGGRHRVDSETRGIAQSGIPSRRKSLSAILPLRLPHDGRAARIGRLGVHGEVVACHEA